MPLFKEKRAYDPIGPEDGFRVYVDKLWPRGLSHATFHYDFWAKEIAPSQDLRHWFHENPEDRWPEFSQKYREELKINPSLPEFEKMLSGHAVVTLLYSSRQAEHNNATVLKNFLEERRAG